MLNTRYFSHAYATCRPLVSQDQRILCMPRFKNMDKTPISTEADLIDLYNIEDEGFWSREDQICTSDEDYKCSLELPEYDSF